MTPVDVAHRPARLAAVVVGVVVLLLVVLLATREPATDRKGTSHLIGEPAPGIGGDVLLGEPFDIGTNDRWLVVNFFASWCGPCIVEHPELVAFSEAHAESGDARVVSVVYSDKESDVREFFELRGGDWTVFDSDQGRTALDWGVARVPESYLVAPTGVVVARFISGVTQAELDAVIDRYDEQLAQQQTGPSGGSESGGPGDGDLSDGEPAGGGPAAGSDGEPAIDAGEGQP